MKRPSILAGSVWALVAGVAIGIFFLVRSFRGDLALAETFLGGRGDESEIASAAPEVRASVPRPAVRTPDPVPPKPVPKPEPRPTAVKPAAASGSLPALGKFQDLVVGAALTPDAISDVGIAPEQVPLVDSVLAGEGRRVGEALRSLYEETFPDATDAASKTPEQLLAALRDRMVSDLREHGGSVTMGASQRDVAMEDRLPAGSVASKMADVLHRERQETYVELGGTLSGEQVGKLHDDWLREGFFRWPNQKVDVGPVPAATRKYQPPSTGDPQPLGK